MRPLYLHKLGFYTAEPGPLPPTLAMQCILPSCKSLSKPLLRETRALSQYHLTTKARLPTRGAIYVGVSEESYLPTSCSWD